MKMFLIILELVDAAAGLALLWRLAAAGKREDPGRGPAPAEGEEPGSRDVTEGILNLMSYAVTEEKKEEKE